MTGSAMGPSGLTMPVTTKTISAATISGVRNFPTISTTLLGLMVRINVRAKKMTATRTAFVSGKRGSTVIS